ncbi:hypothetical protein UR09_01290 [Candidatus Nitromaritima sp. SCGC AAA799-A02]|nr:hypothetical protein UZ36_04025 [Candidatus Nitromaritima sp. SCGC AAA799-C22]KMP12392.1 hypothetical protein UR09_01290 [Candidatus Nitromaritima sp. SCGC AAA799-A02]
MPKNKIRGFIGVKSNDGHDAAILIVADIMKKGGIEVILGGYDLTVDKFVKAILQEGVHFAGISSYNGGHVEFFLSVRDELIKRNYPCIHLIGGGGATITPEDIKVMEQKEGIDKIFRTGETQTIVPYINAHYDFPAIPENPEELVDGIREGNQLAISGFINLAEEKARLESLIEDRKNKLSLTDNDAQVSQFLQEPLEVDGTTGEEVINKIERYSSWLAKLDPLQEKSGQTVYGIAGRGGAGKSTLIDEIVLRFFRDARNEKRKIAILAIDPSSHSSGGALLADRIAYMYASDKNWVDPNRIYIRSVAARGYGNGTARAIPGMIKILKSAGYDILIETYGMGQPDVGIIDLVNIPVFVATPDIGGATQIAKEEMLGFPDVRVVLNKNELRGARHVSSLLQGKIDSERLFHTTAAEHNNPGVDQLYHCITAHYN